MRLIPIRAWCHLNARWVPSRRIKGRAAEARRSPDFSPRPLGRLSGLFAFEMAISDKEAGMEQCDYKRWIADMGETRHGVDGACKALVLGHGGFDPHLAPEMPL